MGRVTSVRVDGLVLDVRDEGPADGTVVLLLHGFPQRSTCWRRVTPLLHEAGLRTLAPDQRGYSPGARPGGRRAYAGARLVGDALAVADAAGVGAVHWVGHDWGAAVGWQAAALRPERLRTLTAVSVPHPAAMLEATRHGDQLRRSWYMALFQVPWLPERLLASRRAAGLLRAGGLDREGAERYRREVVDDGALRGGLMWYRGLPFGRAGDVRRPARVPTTLVWGDGDEALGRDAVDRTARWVAAPYHLEVLPGVRHFVPEEAPAALAAAILARVRA
jgi:pimeloyl-ACP methyl ester carboxylesterase